MFPSFYELFFSPRGQRGCFLFFPSWELQTEACRPALFRYKRLTFAAVSVVPCDCGPSGFLSVSIFSLSSLSLQSSGYTEAGACLLPFTPGPQPCSGNTHSEYTPESCKAYDTHVPGISFTLPLDVPGPLYPDLTTAS